MVLLLFVPSFVKLSQTVSKLLSGHDIYAGNKKKGHNSANNVSEVTSFNLCKMTGNALHCTKFREIISNSIKVIEWKRFLY